MTAAGPKTLRAALGRYATGIAIVTTRARDGAPVGLTVNSFSSVSLDPPLVLWSINKQAASRAVFENIERFAVNVLAAEQRVLSDRFARPGDKFTGLPPGRDGRGGVPLLNGCLASFDCRIVARHDAGDHLIIIGEVEDFDYRDGEPLVYFVGSYNIARAHSSTI